MFGCWAINPLVLKPACVLFTKVFGQKSVGTREFCFGIGGAFLRMRTLESNPTHLAKRETMADFIRIIFSILLPPVGVFFQVGLGLHFWLSIVLTLCGYIPGLVHAIWIIARSPQNVVA
jgi:uncharacterized membrane protein YqaE (UPF0057 family)